MESGASEQSWWAGALPRGEGGTGGEGSEGRSGEDGRRRRKEEEEGREGGRRRDIGSVREECRGASMRLSLSVPPSAAVRWPGAEVQ